MWQRCKDTSWAHQLHNFALKLRKKCWRFQRRKIVWVWLNSPGGIYPYCGPTVLGNMWCSEYLGNIWYFNGKLQQFWHFLDVRRAEIIRKLSLLRFSASPTFAHKQRNGTKSPSDESTFSFLIASRSLWVEHNLDGLIKNILKTLADKAAIF